jgi:hypothetical protein
VIPLTIIEQHGIFQNHCAEVCGAYDVCGGSNSAPCGCIKTDPGERYNCANCWVHCLERRTPNYDIQTQLAEGTDLENLIIEQKVIPQFPLVIPHSTHESPEILPLKWAGIDIRHLLSDSRKKPLHSRALLNGKVSLRERLKLNPNTKLLSILNGNDWKLEGFWGMSSRYELYDQLEYHNFHAVTGPTFSVTDEDKGFPAFHNIIMQMRHHRVMEELQGINMLSIPNIYWRDKRDREKWAEWLAHQGDIHIISREFSRTKNPFSFPKALDEFVDFLSRVGRPFHVLLVSVGYGNGVLALQRLAEIGCTASVITSSPIREAITKGCRLEITESSKLSPIQDRSVSNGQLVLPNLRTVEQYLIRHVVDLPPYSGKQELLHNCLG